MTGGQPEPGVGEILQQLLDDTSEVARSEIALQRAKFFARVERYRGAALLFVAAGTLVLAALVALLIGLIFVIAPHLGAASATAIVVIGTLVVAAICAIAGRGRLTPKADA